MILCVCLALCITLLCSCHKKKEPLETFDINAASHTLEEFEDGDFHCSVTLKDLINETSGESQEDIIYQVDGQDAVDLYNLMNRGEWIPIKEATGTDIDARPSAVNDSLVTLDFYVGRSMDNADYYCGTFQFSKIEFVFLTANPYALNISLMLMPVGTCQSVLDFVYEKGKVK